MITYAWLLPLWGLIWALDSFFFLVAARFALSKLAPSNPMGRPLHELTEPVLKFAAGPKKDLLIAGDTWKCAPGH